MNSLIGVLICMALIITAVSGTTMSTNYRLSVTLDGSATSYIALAHPTPVVALTDNTGTVTLRGIAAGSVNGEVVTVVRTGSAGNFVIVHNDFASGVVSGNLIVLTNEDTTGLSWTMSERGGVKFVYISPYWHAIGYTKA